MASHQRQRSEDLQWLKWWILLLLFAITVSTAIYWGAFYYQGEMRRLENGILTDFDVISQEIRQIESSERIIVENIDRFNTMTANQIMADEDRVSLLEDIRNIRNKYQLFPIDVDVREQNSQPLLYEEGIDYPDEDISLRSSIVQIRLPLLHEEDLTRFLADFLNTGRLMVSNECTIVATLLDGRNLLEFVEHQVATCEFTWYTLRRESNTGPDAFGYDE
ncbi:MAG: hypothetical protein COA96_05195 [SAR86 cluster bacterium]|uniref:Pilus assembly protein PilO n=1 Tax=SAR86 cluster bacterium TaxID=2030880 RepID=A0A2A5B4E1_9GAMM|nr:MAG: hypothetical protein COA96_05195 [SAR86 cluster bacterium]